MYIGDVANLTIYVPADLLADVRRLDIPVSRTCQRALKEQVKRASRDLARTNQPPPRRPNKQQEAR